jgi:hypothetical protein
MASVMIGIDPHKASHTAVRADVGCGVDERLAPARPVRHQARRRHLRSGVDAGQVAGVCCPSWVIPYPQLAANASAWSTSGAAPATAGSTRATDRREASSAALTELSAARTSVSTALLT